MTIALVVHAGAPSGDAVSATTAGIDTTGASLLIICGSFIGTSATVSDSVGGNSNTWTPLTGTLTGGRSEQLFYCASPTVGSGHTFTVTGSFPAICVVAFSNTAASPFDQESNNFGGQPGSITPSEDNEVLVTGLGHSDATSQSIDQSFIITDDIANGGFSVGAAMAYLIETTATAKNPTWTPSNNGRVSMATFKAGTGGGGGTPPIGAFCINTNKNQGTPRAA